MEYNFKMQQILNQFYKQKTPPVAEYSIWKKQTLDGNDFYGIGNFCGIKNDCVIEYGQELTALEWDGNELAFHSDCFHLLITETLSAYLSIKNHLETQYWDRVFDIFVSIDENSCSSNVRFYAVREDYHYIEPTHENLSKFEYEAVLIDTVNRVCLTNYIPILIERFRKYADYIEETNRQWVQITNPYGKPHILIAFEEEFTMYFSDFHSHYDQNSFEEMADDIEHILQEYWGCITVHSDGRWLQSYIGAITDLPLNSNDQLISYLFSHNKDMCNELKEKGGILQLVSWNPQKSIRIVIDRQTTF